VFVLQWQPLRRAYERAAQWLDAIFGLILLGLAVRLMIGW
jgi:threonine/homoserine/homoserine lactone efflux protein